MSNYVLNELLSNGLEMVYAAHHQGAAQVDANYNSSTTPALKSMLKTGAVQNRKQAERLEKIFKLLKLEAKGTPDQAMQGIIDTNNTLIAQTANPTERDLINISAGQHVAHFYLASYGALRHYAKQLGRDKVANLLQKTMDEFGETNKQLTVIAKQIVDHSRTRLGVKKEGGLLRTTIPAFLIVGLVGTAITLATQSASAPTDAD